MLNKRKFPDPSKKASATGVTIEEMSVEEVRQRIFALLAVFAVVIFFWFSFHQNGLTLTFFAKEYTDLTGVSFDLGFTKFEGAELFQSLNPLFVVALTPVIMSVFAWQRARGKEPSTPKKIAIGMGIAATAFLVMKSDKPRTFLQKVGDAFVMIAGFILKVCLVIFAIVCSPILFVLGIVFIALLFAAVAVAVGGGAALISLFPLHDVIMPVSPLSSIVMYIAGILLVGIPLVSIVFVIFRQLFTWQPMFCTRKDKYCFSLLFL